MAYDPHLADLMRDALSGRQGVSERRMFGGPCWMLNGNLMCAAREGRFLFRVGKAAEAEMLERDGVEPMRDTGRRMPGYVWVDADLCLDEGLETWIARSAAFVGGLRPK